MKATRITVFALLGLISGALLGAWIGRAVRSDNLPFFLALGAGVGLVVASVASLFIARSCSG